MIASVKVIGVKFAVSAVAVTLCIYLFSSSAGQMGGAGSRAATSHGWQPSTGTSHAEHDLHVCSSKRARPYLPALFGPWHKLSGTAAAHSPIDSLTSRSIFDRRPASQTL